MSGNGKIPFDLSNMVLPGPRPAQGTTAASFARMERALAHGGCLSAQVAVVVIVTAEGQLRIQADGLSTLDAAILLAQAQPIVLADFAKKMAQASAQAKARAEQPT